MNYRIRYSSELEHHGIKGMRWGERRWQNKDGSLTPAGYIHYGYGKGKNVFDQSGADFDGNTARIVGKTKGRVKGSIGGKTITSISNNKSGDSEDQYDHSQSSYASVAKLAGRVLFSLATGNVEGAILTVGEAVTKSTYSAVKNKKIETANNRGEVDQKTGFHTKEDREYTRKEDMAAVNPGYQNLNDNTKNNCMLCTMTYDLRKRGYAVSANKASRGYQDTDIKRWYPDAQVRRAGEDGEATIDWIRKPFTNVKSAITGSEHKKFIQNTIDELSKQGPGARGNIMVSWTRGGGHSMAYEVNESGKVEILDCQSNKVYKNPQSILRSTNDIVYARLDNVDIDSKNIKEVSH